MLPVNEDDIGLDLPIAVRRKRRSSATTSSPVKPTESTSSYAAIKHMKPLATPKTPSRLRKRVRFSDPFPEASRQISSSTGLTPRLARTSFDASGPRSPSPPTSPQPRRHHKSNQARRRTMPAAVSTEPAVLASTSEPIVIQFQPIRQMLDARTRRGIRRQGLSEAMNEYDADKRLMRKQERMIKELEQTLAAARQEAEAAVEAHRPSESFRRCQQLEAEIRTAQSQLNDRPLTPVSSTPNTNDDENAVDWASPAPTVAFSEDDIEIGPTPAAQEVQAGASDNNHIGVQTDEPFDASSTTPEYAATRTSFLIRARRELEDIVPGETALPLSPSPAGDASPLVNALLHHLRTVKSDLSRTDSSLTAIRKQEQNLRAQFNASLTNVEAVRSQVQGLQSDLKTTNAVYRASRRQAEDLHNQAQSANAQLKVSEEKIQRLEGKAQDYQKGIDNLSKALMGYYDEVANYQKLILEVEKQNTEKTEELKAEHRQTVNELEVQLEAEMNVRAAAEGELDELKSQRLANEHHRKELQEAVHLKQRMLRDLESRLESAQLARQQEVGRLNVAMSNTQTRLNELDEQIKAERQRACNAINMVVQQTQTAGAEAVRELVGGDDGQSIGLGLLTPGIEGGRFRNAVSHHVDGQVEMLRGHISKKRRRNPDSGIGILEEDESEHFSSDL